VEEWRAQQATAADRIEKKLLQIKHSAAVTATKAAADERADYDSGSDCRSRIIN
jgi:hypothetical protein